MRVLLDENVPRKLKYRLAPEHEAVTVPECGWSGLLNGALLRAADAEFDAFVTLDRGLEYQQGLLGLSLRVVILRAVSNKYEDLLRWCLRFKQRWIASVRGRSLTWLDNPWSHRRNTLLPCFTPPDCH